MLFKTGVFKSLSMNSPENLYAPSIPKVLNQLELLLKDEMQDGFVSCQAVREVHSVQIARELPLSAATVRYQVKQSGQITSFEKVTKPYVLQNRTAKAVNASHKSFKVFIVVLI